MDKVQEIMELVGKYGTAVHENSTGNPSNHTLAHEESASYDAVKTALRALLERKPLSDSQIERLRQSTFSTDNPYCPCDSKTMRKAVQAAERAHGIGA